MKASEFIKQLQQAITKHGDLPLVVGYDGYHAEIEGDFDDSEESWDAGSYAFGPRKLVLDNEHDDRGDTGKRCFRI